MMDVSQFHTLSSAGEDGWDWASFRSTPMGYEFLNAVEKSRINDIEPIYLRLSDRGQPVGRANLYKVRMDFSTLDKALAPGFRRAIKAWYPGFMDFKLLECGFFTMIGEGIEATGANRAQCIEAVAQRMERLAAEDEGLDFLMIRDVPGASYTLYKEVLSGFGYKPVLGFPNARLNIRWRSLEAYLALLDSKTRLKLRNAVTRLSSRYGVTHEFVADYGHLGEELAGLWAKVNAKARDYSREQLTTPFFRSCAEHLAGKSEVLLFRHKGRPIAFMLNMFGRDDYIVLDWGVDYGFEHYRQANLYRAATVLCLQRAMERGKARLELGITNYVPKMTLGAAVEPLIYFIKHRTSPERTTTMARLMTDNIVQPDAALDGSCARLGGRQEDLFEWLARIRRDQDEVPDTDLFHKVDRYERMNVLKMAGIYGLRPEFASAQQSSIELDGNRIVLLGTNSYLGAALEPSVIEAARRALEKYGSGCSGSPLLNGTLDIHNKLEKELAEFCSREDAVLCSSGYQTNLAGMAALCRPGDLIIMDARNHRSLFDGAKLSGADYIVYAHDDMAHLERILRRNAGRPMLIATDSLFSMEGTVADLPAITALAKQYGARTYVDESHAVGVLGARGRGAAELLGVDQDVDVTMATFSKSFASIGGFIAADKRIIDYIRHNASPHIFSASLPPVAIETVRAVLRLIRQRPEMRADILEKARFMAEGLADMGYRARFLGTQIVPVIFGNYTVALAGYRRLMDRGVYVNPVGPPAVPESDAGFRTSYIANHDWDDLRQALQVFQDHREHFLQH